MQPNFETATWAAGAMAAQDMGRPAVAAAAKSGGARSGSAPPPEVDIPSEVQAAIIASTLKLLKTVSVSARVGIGRWPCAVWWGRLTAAAVGGPMPKPMACLGWSCSAAPDVHDAT